MDIVPHFQFPLSIGGDGHLRTVMQDSDEDILSCVYVALKTPINSRPYVPGFGVDDMTFSGPVPLPLLESQIEASEPRASASMSAEITELLMENIEVGVENIG